MLRLEAHLALPGFPQVLLHNLVLLEHGLVFEDLCLDLMLDEFLVLRTLNLTTGLAELAVVVDLVGQVHS